MTVSENPVEVICLGGAHIDVIAQASASIIIASSNPGTVSTALGGVALNVARALASIGHRTALIGGLGQDREAETLIETLTAEGIDLSQMARSAQHATGRYIAIEQADGELSVAVSDTAALDHLQEAHFQNALQAFPQASILFADTNLSAPILNVLATQPNRPKLAVDTVSVAKSRRLQGLIGQLDIIFCNVSEAGALLAQDFSSSLEAAQAMADNDAQSTVVTNGHQPVAVFDGKGCTELPVPPSSVTSVTGAGDSLVAGTLSALLSGDTLCDAAIAGIEAARRKISQ